MAAKPTRYDVRPAPRDVGRMNACAAMDSMTERYPAYPSLFAALLSFYDNMHDTCHRYGFTDKEREEAQSHFFSFHPDIRSAWNSGGF